MQWVVFALREKEIQGAHYPPVGVQIRLTLAHLFGVIPGIGRTDQGFDYISNGKIPVVISFIPNGSNLLRFKQLDVVHCAVFSYTLLYESG